MALLRNKTYRVKMRSNIGYTQVITLMLGFALVFLGIFGYAVPDFGIEQGHSMILAMVGAFILFIGLISPIIEITNVSQIVGIIIAMFVVFILMFLGLILSGVLEVTI